MRRSSILGAASVAALAAGSLAVTERQRLESPRGAVDPRRPDRGQHRPVRVHGAGRAGQPDDRLELDPVRGPVERPVLRQARSEGALLRQDRQHRRRPRGRRVPVAVQAALPQPELVPLRGADGRLRRRPGHQLRPDVRPLSRDLQRNGKRQARAQIAARPAGRARQRRAEDDPGLRARSPPAPCQTLSTAAKTFVGPADDPFFIDLAVVVRRHQHRQARPAGHRPRQPGRRQGRRRRLQHALVRPAGARVRRHARRQERRRARRRATRSSASGRRTERKRIRVRAPPAASAACTARWVQVSRLGNPLINEVIIPIGLKDKFNRTSPADDAANFGAGALAPEPARLLNALFGLGVKETDRTDIVQALLTGVPGLTQIGSPAGAGRHAEGQPRRAAERQPEPLRRAGG